ncbi:glycosyltransferase [Mycobacterium sp. 1165178.9]|uniref:glycosyltransferase n=1 Tax=Mycobacterium sp. 1165178.9 TaxID=1834070 RepID=UPI0008015270|nr:glycosyltransferase [Mycobacterium sp. 1165178.9]OBK88054.1 glycosyl transferase family 1 [Mycobacterium sp. 1165178.9]
MKFVLACYGTRGDVEPGAALGRELLSRGHEVRMAVPPNVVDFVESAGLAAIAYGPDAQTWHDVHQDLVTHVFGKFWKIQDVRALVREDWQLLTHLWREGTTKLMPLAEGADLIITGAIGEESAANVAEYYGIPLATLHYFPLRPNGSSESMPLLPTAAARSAMKVNEWLGWPMMMRFDGAQRRELGLPKATGPVPRRIAKRGSMEIQAYDEFCFPGLAAEWAQWNGKRPFVGALTMGLPTDADEEVASWIAAGTPPIYFGFGSHPVESPAETLAGISAVCEQLGERALVCAGWSDFSGVSDAEHVKVVSAVNHSATFPACRAVVHHGGAGTTAAGLRAGVPTLILSTWVGDQRLSGGIVKRLKVGSARPLLSTGQDSLLAELRTILSPDYVARAREVGARMTPPAASRAAAARLLEDFAHQKCVADR